jgi:Spy/CpxP family protein refolding chaperone
MRGAHPLRQWADDLKLTEDQRAQIRSALHARFNEHQGEHRGGEHPWADEGHRGAKVLSAFKQDRFVMDEVAPARDISQMAARMSDHMLGLAETVLPLLTPEQRALAANKLRERASDGAAMGPGL